MGFTFRPHHFLCTLAFKGKGYSATFIKNFALIVEQLNCDSSKMTLIEVTEHTDSICAPCPSRREHLCQSQEKIEKLDKAHAKILLLQSGDKITWQDAKARIAEKMTLDKFHEACAPCEWKKYGMCEEVLKELLNKR